MSINKNLVPSYSIVNGPNRDRLIDAFKYAYGDDRVNTDFAVAIGYSTVKESGKRVYTLAQIDKMTIYSISHEDGSGESFNLSGGCHACLERFGGVTKPYKFEAYYHARTREGIIWFEED